MFEELLHIPALSHLSTSIKRELASIIVFESHAHAGTVCELNFKRKTGSPSASLLILFVALRTFLCCCFLASIPRCTWRRSRVGSWIVSKVSNDFEGTSWLDNFGDEHLCTLGWLPSICRGLEKMFMICLHCKSLSIEFFHYLIKHVGTQTMLLRLRLVPSSGPKRFIFWLPCQWKIIIPFRSLFWVELKKLNNILLLHLCRRYCDTQQDDKGSRCST